MKEDNNKNKDITKSEILLNDSRITPTGNGDVNGSTPCVTPSSGQKWWASILLGFIFAIISSPAAYFITSTVTTTLDGLPLMYGPGPSLVGLLIHSIIFALIIRLILW